MVKCPLCGHVFAYKELCPRLISKSDAKRNITPYYKKISNVGQDLSDKIHKFIINKSIGVIFAKSELKNYLDIGGQRIEKYTEGDDIYKCLDMYVCLGVIERVEHNVNINPNADKRECLYRRPENQIICSFLKLKSKYKDTFKCTCPNEEFIRTDLMIEEDNVHTS